MPCRSPNSLKDRQALLMQRTGGRVVTLLPGNIPQITEGVGDALPVPQLPEDRQALLVQRTGGSVVALDRRSASRLHRERRHAPCVFLRLRAGQQSGQAFSSFAQMTPYLPKPMQGSAEPQPDLALLPLRSKHNVSA